MGWRETLRETVASFLRELRDPEAPEGGAPAGDPVVEAIAAARAELLGVERELALAATRLDHEEQAAAHCERRRVMAERIGDGETASVAARFGRRHAERTALLRRKRDVLADELALARRALEDLLDYARPASPDVSASGAPREERR